MSILYLIKWCKGLQKCQAYKKANGGNFLITIVICSLLSPTDNIIEKQILKHFIMLLWDHQTDKNPPLEDIPGQSNNMRVFLNPATQSFKFQAHTCQWFWHIYLLHVKLTEWKTNKQSSPAQILFCLSNALYKYCSTLAVEWKLRKSLHVYYVNEGLLCYPAQTFIA